MLQRLLSHFSFHVYFAFCPYDDPRARDGAANYLIDLWRHFPKMVALSHTMLCLFVYAFASIAIPFRPLSLLTPEQRDRYVTGLLVSRWYPLRLIAYAVKGHALVAIFRDKSLRDECHEVISPVKEPSHEAHA